MLHATLQVVRFELVRTLTVGRIAIWIALGVFPSLLVATLQIQGRGRVPEEVLTFIGYVLVPQISCMLGLLLWATPAIGAEIEAQSWVYLVLRQHGRVAVALGKYLVAVAWTASYGILSAVTVSLICGVDRPDRMIAALIALVLLASCCYAALYLLIGATFSKRATIIAVVYSLGLEGLISWVPATINQVTVSYRLRSLLVEWTDLDIRPGNGQLQFLFGSEPAWFNVAALLLYAGLFLAVAVLVVRNSEYPVQTDA